MTLMLYATTVWTNAPAPKGMQYLFAYLVRNVYCVGALQGGRSNLRPVLAHWACRPSIPALSGVSGVLGCFGHRRAHSRQGAATHLRLGGASWLIAQTLYLVMWATTGAYRRTGRRKGDRARTVMISELEIFLKVDSSRSRIHRVHTVSVVQNDRLPRDRHSFELFCRCTCRPITPGRMLVNDKPTQWQ
jgi:hypothetical protein